MNNLAVTPDHTALIITTAQPAALSLEGVSVSRQLGGTYELSVPWTFNHAFALSAMGAPSVSPMMRDYDWPKILGEHDPMAHQYRVAGFLSLAQRAYCFADMGTGKTASAIWAADYLRRIGVIKSVLVVCPLTIINEAWRNGIKAILPGDHVGVLFGTKQRRLDTLAQPADWYVVNFDGVELLAGELAKRKFDLIIVDELTAYKNCKTARWKALSSIVRDQTWVWGMTGTPTPNDPTEAFGQAKLVTPWTVPQYFGAFRDATMYKKGNYTWLPKADCDATVRLALQPAVRVKKADCLDLPPVTHAYYEVPLSPEQLKAYTQLKKDSLAQFDGETITALNAAVLSNKLLQVASGTIYTDDGAIVELDGTPRLKLLPEIIDAAKAAAREELGDKETLSGKTIIFAPFKHTVQMIVTYLKEKGYSVAVVDGDASATRRTEIFQSFQNTNDLDAIIAVPSAMSHGVTATAASVITWYSPCASAEVYQQACNRIDRPGQKTYMTIVHLYGSPVERKMYRVLQDRRESQESVLSMYKEFLTGA